MEVQVLEHLADGRVRVRSSYGTFAARWHGDLPQIGSQQRVEVDVHGVALWGEDIGFRDAGIREVVDDGDRVRISGLVSDFGADDVVVLTLNGSPVMIDTDGEPPIGVVGRYVAVRVSNVTLYPYEL